MKWLVIIFETFPCLLSLFALILVCKKILVAFQKGEIILFLLLFFLLLFTISALLYFLFYLVVSLGTKIENYNERLR
jgi:hypothetical protein